MLVNIHELGNKIKQLYFILTKEMDWSGTETCWEDEGWKLKQNYYCITFLRSKENIYICVGIHTREVFE